MAQKDPRHGWDGDVKANLSGDKQDLSYVTLRDALLKVHGCCKKLDEALNELVAARREFVMASSERYFTTFGDDHRFKVVKGVEDVFKHAIHLMEHDEAPRRYLDEIRNFLQRSKKDDLSVHRWVISKQL